MVNPLRKSNPLFAPAILLVLLLGAAAYNLYLANDGARLRRQLSSLQLKIHEKREILRSLELLDQERQTMAAFPPSAWVPIVANQWEARLHAEKKVMDAVRDVKALQPELEWKEETASGLRRAYLTFKALFPSYDGFLRCLRGFEEEVPPLLPCYLEMNKEGMKVRVSLTLGFHYRLQHEGT